MRSNSACFFCGLFCLTLADSLLTRFLYEPWAIIEACISEKCSASSIDQAKSFFRQSQEYFRAASLANAIEAKPVLLYYSFLNLAKAFMLTRGTVGAFGRIQHGLADSNDSTKDIQAATLDAYPSKPSTLNAFDLFHQALTGNGIGKSQRYPLQNLMSQILLGHRLWCNAAKRKERFIALHKLAIFQQGKEIWIRIGIKKHDLHQSQRTLKELLSEAGLKSEWNAVYVSSTAGGEEHVCFELIKPIEYTHRLSDRVMELIEKVKPLLHRTIASIPPYRRYYLYLNPIGQIQLPQLMGYYALIFYLSSVTRYRPERFLKTLDGKYGAFIRQFLEGLPDQFLFEMACEFRQQEVTRAAVL